MGAVSPKDHGEICMVCEQVKWKGFHLYHSFLCTECEQEIIHTSTNHPKYTFYLQKLRQIKAPKIFF